MKRKTIILSLVIIMAITCLSVPSLAMAAETTDTTDTTDTTETTEDINQQETVTLELTATAISYNSVKLSWTGAAAGSTYAVYMSEDNVNWEKVRETKYTTYTVKKLTTGKNVKFKVEVIGNAEVAADSTEGTVSNLASAKPKLGNVKITTTPIATTAVKISWTKVPGADKYKIYRYNPKTDTYKGLKTVSARTASYTNTKLTPGTKYKYLVRAEKTTNSTVAKTDTTKTVKTVKKLTWNTPGFKYTNAYKVMKLAKSKVGCAYVSGAAGAYQFDCSGYAYWINKTAKVSGKSFSRGSAQSEWSQVKRYSIGRSYKNAQPGDLVFISSSGSKSNITHVAFYYGNNKLIHATNPRTDVAITSTAWSGGQSKVVDIVRLPNM